MACGALPWQWGGCAGDVAKSVAGDAFSAIARSFGQAAADATGWLWAQMGQATAVNLTRPGFSAVLGLVATIAATVAVGLFVLQVATSALRREPAGLARALRGLVVAFVGGGAAVVVVNSLLGATDALCNGIAQAALGTDVAGLGSLVLGSAATAALSGLLSGGGAAAGVLLLALAVLAAVVIVYVALVVRKVLIVVTAVFAPLAFVGSLADFSVAWTRRWVETTVALVFSKLVLVLIFVVGYFMLVDGVGQAGSGTTQELTQLVSGVLVLALAGFAPWVALKVVHFTGDHAHHLHSLASGATAGTAGVARMAQKAGPLSGAGADLARRASTALSSSTAGSDSTGAGASPERASAGTGSSQGAGPAGAGPAAAPGPPPDGTGPGKPSPAGPTEPTRGTAVPSDGGSGASAGTASGAAAAAAV